MRTACTNHDTFVNKIMRDLVYCMWENEDSKGLHLPKRLVVLLHSVHVLYVHT